MVSIKWCLKVKDGIRLVEPSDFKSQDYIERAEEDIAAMQTSVGHWKLITAYYACYDVLYALLMKIGIKSEIHDCSIKLMEMLDFKKEQIEFLKKLKKERIQVQYYLKNIPLENEDEVRTFVLDVKEKISNIKKEDINQIMAKIKEAQNEA